VILVALELASGGELFDFLSYTGAFEDQIARSYFRQLVSGLSACHSAGIVHRDLKPGLCCELIWFLCVFSTPTLYLYLKLNACAENIALSSDFVLKIIDFGLSAPNLAARSLITPCGTTAYMAPEIFNRQPYNGASTDIFAAGVVLFVSLAGFPPFQKASPADWWFHKLCTQQHDLFWQAHSRTAYFSPNAKDLLVRMLEPDPAKRITLEDVVAHPWFNGPTLECEFCLLITDCARSIHRFDCPVHLRCRMTWLVAKLILILKNKRKLCVVEPRMRPLLPTELIAVLMIRLKRRFQNCCHRCAAMN
jgi:serine/threonine protein kinase